MKASIDKAGMLTVQAETELEAYALGRWVHENPVSDSQQMDTENLCLDWSLEAKCDIGQGKKPSMRQETDKCHWKDGRVYYCKDMAHFREYVHNTKKHICGSIDFPVALYFMGSRWPKYCPFCGVRLTEKELSGKVGD